MRPIHENLKAARGALKRRGKPVPLREIAAHLQSLGLNYGTAAVGHWFTGRNKPPVDALKGLAEKLQTDIDTLVSGDPAYVSDPTSRLLLESFEKLPQAKREAVLAFIKSFADDS